VNVNRSLVWLAPVVLSLGLGGASLVTAQDSSDGAYLKAVSTIYAGGKVAGFVRDWCDLRAPQFKDASARALEAWRRDQNLVEVESRFAALAGNRRADMDANIEGSRKALYDRLEGSSKDPASDCRDLAGLLNKTFNLKALYADEYRIIAARPATSSAASPNAGSSNTPASSPPAPSLASPSASGTLYTLAQLSAIFEDTRRKTQGSNDAKSEAAGRAIQALGAVYIIGKPSSSTLLEYATERGASKRSGSCSFKGDNDFRDLGLIGKTIIVRASATPSGLGIFDLEDCEVIPNATGLQKSTVSEDSGLDLRAEAASLAVSAGVNKGLKPNQIDGVYLEQNTGIGVGGMVIIRYDPVLMLKDGWAYDGWTLTPADLDVTLSRKLEPKSWRRYERKGDQIRIQDQNGKWSKFEKWSQVGPAKPGDTLQGTFSSIGGGGNTAVGGNTMIAVIDSYTFNKDGTFKTDKAVGASGGNEGTDPNGPPGVVATSQASSSGTYKLDGYTLELRYGNGRVMRRAFLWFDEKQKDAIFIDGTAFLSKK
jgi:hypothetical protein